MRGALLVVWVLLPLGLVAYHLGPGQERMKLDAAGRRLEEARAHAARAEWAAAVEAYDQAMAALPVEEVAVRRRARLERDKAAMQASGLPEANDDLDALLAEVQAAPAAERAADPALEHDVRQALASAQFYMTWLMRLEGRPREDWEPMVEAARQNDRLLAERATDPAVRRGHEEDLAAAIRLERLDLGELQGLPLPSQ
jgi:hypothetical protein